MEREERTIRQKAPDLLAQFQSPYCQAQTLSAATATEPAVAKLDSTPTAGAVTVAQTGPWCVIHCLPRQKDASDYRYCCFIVVAVIIIIIIIIIVVVVIITIITNIMVLNLIRFDKLDRVSTQHNNRCQTR